MSEETATDVQPVENEPAPESEVVTPTEEETAPEADKTEGVDGDDKADEQKADEKAKEEPKPKKRHNSAQKRISQLTREKNELKAKLEKAEYQQKLNSIEQKRPKAGDFESDEDFVEALTDYKVNKALTEREEPKEPSQSEEYGMSDEEFQEFQKSSIDLMETGSKQFEDFAEVVTTVEDLSVDLVKAVMDHSEEHAAEMVYKLAQDPDLIKDLSRTNSQFAQNAILAQIEQGLGKAQTPKEDPKPQTTKAPAPIKPVGGSGASGSVDPDKMSPDEWVQWRRKQL